MEGHHADFINYWRSRGTINAVIDARETSEKQELNCGLYGYCEKRDCPPSPSLPLEFLCDHAWEINRWKFIERVKTEIDDMDLAEIDRVNRFIKNQVKAKRCR